MYGQARFEDVAEGSDYDDLLGSGPPPLSQKFTLDAGSVVRGEVVGLITASGKVIGSVSDAGDGSQTAFGIASHDADASDGDVELNVYVRGNFNANRVVLSSGGAHTIASIRETLRDKGIYLEWPVKQYP